MAVTLSQLRTIGYDILREEENTTAYPYTLMDLMINSAQKRICAGKVVNPLTKEVVRKGELPFLQTTKYYTNQNTTSLSSDLTTGATTIQASVPANYPTSGYLYIAGNIVTYTGTTSTSFTGVSGVLFDFKAGTQISLAFALPTDYSSSLNIVYNNRFKLPQQLYDDMWENLNQYKGTNYNRNRSSNLYGSPYRVNPFYTIINGQYIVLFNVNDTDGIIQLRYEKKPTIMSSESDTATIDDDIYAQTTIPYLAVGEMLFNRGEETRASQILNFGIGQLTEMYSFYDNKTYERISGVQYRMGKSKLNI